MKAGWRDCTGDLGAALVPVAVLVPLINNGSREDSECGKLLAEARVKPVAAGQDLPPKSQTQTQVNE